MAVDCIIVRNVNHITVESVNITGGGLFAKNVVAVPSVNITGSGLFAKNVVAVPSVNITGSGVIAKNVVASRQRYSCLDCMTTKTALQKSWICKICATTKTRAGICRSCSNELGFTEEISLEATVRASFEHFFPGISTNQNIFLGGKGCADCPTENSHFEDKSNRFKGAYVDIPIITEDVRINIEVDENAHRYYDPACELARYDTVTFGADEKVLKQNWVLRFNPQNVGEVKLELVDRIKIIIEYVLRIEHNTRCRFKGWMQRGFIFSMELQEVL